MAQDFFVNFSEPSFPTASVAGGFRWDLERRLVCSSDLVRQQTHPLPRGGTDSIAFDRPLLSNSLTEHYRNLVYLVGI